MKSLVILLTSLLGTIPFYGQEDPYLIGNENYPDTAPVIYGENIISHDSIKMFGISFTPDGKELIFSVKSDGVYYMKNSEGKWSEPELLEFSKNSLTHIMYPKFSPDGSFISFVDGNSKDYGHGDIFIVNRGYNNKWLKPIKLPEPVNSMVRDAGHCFTPDDKLYFATSRFDVNSPHNDIYVAKPMPGGDMKVDIISEISIISIISDEENLYVSPNEEYIIFDSWRIRSKRKLDMFISYRLPDNRWTVPVALNTNINTEQMEGSPFVSSDNKYLFFSRSTHNGSKIFWVSTKQVFKPYQNLSIPDFYEKAGEQIHIQFADSTFKDFDGSITEYELYEESTGKLPEYLTFNKETLTIEGIPQEALTLDMVIKAIDNDQNEESAEFSIIVR